MDFASENSSLRTLYCQTDVVSNPSLTEIVELDQETEKSTPTSPVELDSSPAGYDSNLDGGLTLAWMTAFPHQVGGRVSNNTNLVLLSRDFTDLRTAQKNLRQPGRDIVFDVTYGSTLQHTREGILKRAEKPEKKKKPKGCWLKTAKKPCTQRAMCKRHSRHLDDQQDRRIADTFADSFFGDCLPPSLKQDLEFNVYHDSGVLGHNNGQAQFPLVFRAMVPVNWRGLSPHPADVHNVHILELTEAVRDDLIRFWYHSWDLREWPEVDIYETRLKRMRSWNSRYEVDDDDDGIGVWRDGDKVSLKKGRLARADTDKSEKSVKREKVEVCQMLKRGLRRGLRVVEREAREVVEGKRWKPRRMYRFSLD
ncbi:MAG: hypothetical protein Q9219_002661 [cf. Caloplaca sp. 3 TL-2023]